MEQPDGAKWVFAATIFGVAGLTALISNAMVLLTNYYIKESRSKHHFVSALAISDILGGLSGLFRSTLPSVGFHAFTHTACTYREIPLAFSMASGPLIMLLLSVYRLIGFWKPKWFQFLVSKKMLLAVYALIIAVPTANVAQYIRAADGNHTVAICMVPAIGTPDTRRRTSGGVVLLTVGVIVTNVLLYIHIKTKAHETKGVTGVRDRQLARAIIKLSAVYVSTWVITVMAFAYTQFRSMTGDEGQKTMYLYFGWWGMINFGSNYFIYLHQCTDYRKLFRRQKCTKVNTVAVLDLSRPQDDIQNRSSGQRY